MSIEITYRCNGCEATATVQVRESIEVVGQAYIGGVLCDERLKRVPRIADAAPDGWVAFDPYTSCTYCPACWTAIEGTTAA